MKVKILIFGLLVLTLSKSYGQLKPSYIDIPVELKDRFYEKGIEISSLAVYGNTLYLLPESCRKLYSYDLVRKKFNETIELKEIGQDMQLEGMAFFNDRYFFFTDEVENKLHIYDLENRKVLSPTLPFADKPTNKGGEKGLEGLEYNRIDEDKGLLYLLRERNGQKNFGYLYCFKVSEKNGWFTFEIQHFSGNEKVKIELNKNEGYRFSDLCLSEDKKALLLLRTSESKHAYYIDLLKLDASNHLPIESQYNLGKLPSKEIYGNDTFKINGMSSNLEGIEVYNGEIYLVSDNNKCGDTSSKCCDEKSDKKTFFGKANL